MVKLSRRYFLRILIFTGAFVGIIIQKINILATTFNSAKPKPIMPISNIDEVVEIQVELLVQGLKKKGITKTPREIEDLKETLRRQLKSYFMTRFELSND